MCPGDERLASSDDPQTVAWQNLPRYHEEIDKVESRLEQVWSSRMPATALTDRAFDESQPAGRRVYMSAHRNLNIFLDNYRALWVLFANHGATVWAPWSLIRPMFECSFLAAWVLDPSAGLQRRQRGLRLEVWDFREQQNHLGEFRRVAEMSNLVAEEIARRDREIGSVYRREAEAVNWKYSISSAKPAVARELEKLGFVNGEPDLIAHLIGTWRVLSGLEHGLSYAALQSSDRAQEVGIPGGQQVRLTIADGPLVNALKTTYFLFFSAANLFIERTERYTGRTS